MSKLGYLRMTCSKISLSRRLSELRWTVTLTSLGVWAAIQRTWPKLSGSVSRQMTPSAVSSRMRLTARRSDSVSTLS